MRRKLDCYGPALRNLGPSGTLRPAMGQEGTQKMSSLGPREEPDLSQGHTRLLRERGPGINSLLNFLPTLPWTSHPPCSLRNTKGQCAALHLCAHTRTRSGDLALSHEQEVVSARARHRLRARDPAKLCLYLWHTTQICVCAFPHGPAHL